MRYLVPQHDKRCPSNLLLVREKSSCLQELFDLFVIWSPSPLKRTEGSSLLVKTRQSSSSPKRRTRVGFHTLLAKSVGSEPGRGSLPPDFANRCVKSLAIVFTRYLPAFCSITAHFRQILPAYLQAFGSIAAHFREILPADL